MDLLYIADPSARVTIDALGSHDVVGRVPDSAGAWTRPRARLCPAKNGRSYRLHYIPMYLCISPAIGPRKAASPSVASFDSALQAISTKNSSSVSAVRTSAEFRLIRSASGPSSPRALPVDPPSETTPKTPKVPQQHSPPAHTPTLRNNLRNSQTMDGQPAVSFGDQLRVCTALKVKRVRR